MTTLIPSSEDVRIYETCIMYAPDLSQKEEAQLQKNIEAHFSEADGKQLFKDAWSRRGLAYKVKGHGEAKFVVYYHELDPAKIRTVESAIRLEKGVLRHLILLPPKGYEAVSFEDRYQEWMKTRETASDMRAREREEKVKERVKAKAKMEARRMEAQKKKRPAKKEESEKALDKENLSAELDKLISDEDLSI